VLSRLLELLGVDASKPDATERVAKRINERFVYVADLERTGEADNWPTRAEVVANLSDHGGKLIGDCDDYAFAAALALHDLGLGARVVVGACETGAGHMVCEDEHGSVIDNRWPGRVLTWRELERIGYRSWTMNSLDFEERPEQWDGVKVGADGCRDYT
jgi:predicted transglutaminase-like cysteine proteinase